MKKLNPNLLYESIGGIDESLFAECEGENAAATAFSRPWKKLLRSSRLRTLAATAACLCVAVGAIAALPFFRRDDASSRDGAFHGVVQGSVSDPEGELAVIPPFAESDPVRRFPELSFNGKVYTGHFAPLPEEKIGEAFGKTTLHSYNYDSYENTPQTVEAALYRIDGIDPLCAVAVKQAGEEGYFPYTNSLYAPATLGQMLDDLSLRETLTFGPVYGSDDSTVYRFRSADGETAAESTPADALLSLLLSSSDAKAVKAPQGVLPSCDVSVNLSLLGYQNMALSVFEEGYLQTNLLDTGKTFFVGKEKVKVFLDYLEEHYEKVPYSPSSDGEPIPE